MKPPLKSANISRIRKPGTWARIKIFLREFEWSIVAIAAIIAIVLGIVGVTKYLDGRKLGPLDIVYYLVQLFVFEAGLDTGKEIPLSLSIAHLLAPAVFGYAAVKTLGMVFRDQLQLFFVRYFKQHTIICGLGHKGLQLVQEYRALGERVVVIEADAENDEISTCRELGAIVLIGNAADQIVLDKASLCNCRCLFAVTGDEGANVEIAVRTYERVTHAVKKQKHIVKCFVNVDDIRLAELVQMHPLFLDSHDAIEVRLLKINKIAARQLFKQHPLDYKPILRESPLTVHLLIVGFGRMGENVALQAARISHFANQKKLKITVVDRDADHKESIFMRNYPNFRQIAEIVFVAIDFESTDFLALVRKLLASTDTLVTITVCINNNMSALTCALSIAPLTRESDVPIHVRLDTNSGLASLLHTNKGISGIDRNLNAFGMLTSSCKPDIIEERTLDLLARKIHEDLVIKKTQQGKTSADNLSLLPWEQLPGPIRDAKRQQADHIPVKLRAIGCQVIPNNQGTGVIDFDNFTEEELITLTAVEKTRSTAEQILSGHGGHHDFIHGEMQSVEDMIVQLRMAGLHISRDSKRIS